MKKKIFGYFTKLSGADSEATRSAPKDNPATIQENSENGVRRHLVQMLLRDLLRKHGIPAPWIDCQMLVVSSRTKGSGMHLRLVVRHWDPRLMNYASAFQTALLSDIRQFEPQAAAWLHGVSWQLEVEGSCPHTTLPDASLWLKPALVPAPGLNSEPEQPRPKASGQTDADKLAELERHFSLRDQQLAAQTTEIHNMKGYEKTEPAPL